MNWKTDLNGAQAAVGPLCLAVLLTVAPALAQTKERGKAAQKRPQSTVRTPAMSDALYKKLAKAQKHIEENKDYLAASRVLDALLARPDRLNGYELASIHNIYGYIYYAEEREADALRAYGRVLSNPQVIPVGMRINTLYVLAQLLFGLENYSRAREHLHSWFELVEKPSPAAYVLLAHCNYRLNKFDEALRDVKRALALAEQRGTSPREAWYLLLRTLHYERQEYPQTAAVLRELLVRWPKREYWMQWGAMSGQLGNERQQLLAMETAYLQDMLKRESMQLNLSYLLLAADTPYKAARVLERGLADESIEATAKNLALLGTAWRSAREDELAMQALERAAGLAEEGDIWGQLARLYYDNYRYAKSAEAARSALQHKQLERRGSVQLLLGMSLFQMGQIDNAKIELRELLELAERELDKLGDQSTRLKLKDDVKASGSGWDGDQEAAQQWLDYIDGEVRRRALLEQELISGHLPSRG